MSKALFNIPLGNGKIWEVEAEVVGDLALHQDRKDKKRWSITHIPTLLHMKDVMPQINNKAKLLKWMTDVQQGQLKDWLAMKKFTHADVMTDPEHTAGVRARIKAHCLKVEV